MKKPFEQIIPIFRKIDSSRVFQFVVIAVIITSALVIGAKTHNIPGNVLSILVVMDVTITVFFAIEITIRYIASENSRAFFSRGWNIFDTLIVFGWYSELYPAD